MTAILMLLGISITMAAAFLAAFIWSARKGQFDDTTTPAMRMLNDDPRVDGE